MVLIVVNPNWQMALHSQTLTFGLPSGQTVIGFAYQWANLPWPCAIRCLVFPYHLFWCVGLDVLELAKHFSHSLFHTHRLFEWPMPNNTPPPPLILPFMPPKPKNLSTMCLYYPLHMHYLHPMRRFIFLVLCFFPHRHYRFLLVVWIDDG